MTKLLPTGRPSVARANGVDGPTAFTALVTGSEARMTTVAAVLEEEGFLTVCAPPDVPGLAEGIGRAGLSPGTLDCYVQLPATEIGADSGPPLTELRAFVADTLLGRFDALAVVAPLLAPGARLVMVTGDRAGWIRDSDVGLPGVSSALAEAILAGTGAHDVPVTVVSDGAGPDDIVLAARRPAGALSAEMLAGYAAVAPELNYADWRAEVLGLATGPEGVPRSFRGRDGRR
jgi:hypothetical protein